MTINGGQPHKVGYDNQDFKITVHDKELNQRRTVGWSPYCPPDEVLRSLELRPGWSDAKCEVVEDHKTGI